MQSFKSKPVFRLVAVDRSIARTVAVNASPATHAEPVKSFKDIPSPPRLPIIGQLHHFLPGETCVPTCKQKLAVAMSFFASEYLFKHKRRHIIWVKKWLLQKEEYSDLKLLKELSCNEPHDFKKYLRMDVSTFEELLNMVTPYLQKQDTRMRNCISVKERLAVTLRFLATGRSYECLKFSYGDLKFTSALELGLKLYGKFGPIVRIDGLLGMPDSLILFDPESSAQVLRSENLGMPVRPGFKTLDYYRKNKNGEDVTNGLLTDHGEIWKKFRSTVNPVLLQPKTIKLYNGMLDSVAKDMVTRMRSIRGENGMLQNKFDMEMNLWSLESISLVALGRRLNCFNSNLPADSPEKRLIQLVHDIFEIANKLEFRPSLWRYYQTKTFKKAMKMYEEQESIARHFVDKTIEEINKRGDKKSDDEKGVLEKLLEINKRVAVTMASDMLFAGVDTAANTMTATLYLLATNQTKQDKLREELTSQGEKKQYLKACLKESLRMMPVVAGNARIINKEYNLLGYHIPKGTQVSFMHQTMAVLEENYPKPMEYIPERWLTKKDDPLYHGHAHPFAYGPFGFGVRSCIGRRIAELEMEIFLSRIIQNFKVEWFGPPPKVTASSLNYITGPFNFVFKDV